MKTKKHKIYTKIILASGIFIVALLLFIYLASKSYIYIKVTPRESTVELDDKAFKSNKSGVYKALTTPGKHVVLVKANNHVGISKEYNLRRGIKTTIKVDLKEITPSESPESSLNLIEKGGKLLTIGQENQNDFYYSNDKLSQFFKGTFEGTVFRKNPITEPKMSGIKEIIWSPTKELALLIKTDNNINLFDFKKYDFINQSEIPWGNNIGSVAWAPDNSQIAYFSDDGNGKSLFLSDIPNKNKERVINFNEHNDIINPLLKWSADSNFILVLSRSKNNQQNNVYVFSTFSRKLVAYTEDGSYTDAIFNADNNFIVANKSDSSYLIDFKKPNEAVKLSAFLDLHNLIADSKNYNVVYTLTNGSLFGFDLSNNKKSGYVIDNIGNQKIELCYLLNSGKILVYQTPEGVFWISLE